MAGHAQGMSGTGPPAEPAEDYASLFAIERDRLSELLSRPGGRGLGAALAVPGMERPGAVLPPGRRRPGAAGPAPRRLLRHPAPPGATEAEFVAWLDELQAEWVRAARRLSPRLVTDLLRWAGPQITGTFRREDPRARTASVSWAGHGPVPAWLDQARELSEYWIHRQQILQALGRPSDLRADLAGPVLGRAPLGLPLPPGPGPGAARRHGDDCGHRPGRPDLAAWWPRKSGWEFRDRPGPRVVASLAMATEQAWRLLTNNLPAAARERTSRHRASDAITGILLRTRAIIGTPRWA